MGERRQRGFMGGPAGRCARGLAVATLIWASMAAAQGASEDAPSGAADEPRFHVWEYRVLGNSTLPVAVIERTVYPFLGEDRSMTDVEACRANLERVYRAAGYGTVFVDVPEQTVDDGIVRLRVTEGRIDRVRIVGARFFSNSQIRRELPALASGQVPHLPQVQEELNELNRRAPDRAVVPVLRAGRTPGTVDVELKVDDELPVHAGVEMNDRYTPDTSRLRITGWLRYDNLFQKQHSLSLSYQTAPEELDDVEAIVGTYVFPLEAVEDTTFVVYGVDSSSDVATVGTLGVVGNGQIFGLRAIRSLPGSAEYFHSATLGVDYKDFVEDIRLDDGDGFVTPISYLNWTTGYAGTLRRERSLTSFNLDLNLGIRGLQNDPAEFADKRYQGAPNYFYLRGKAEHVRTLGANFQLFGRLGGQFTDAPLISNEQLALGGLDTVRGYVEASHFGDYGAYGTLELRHTWLSSRLGLPAGRAYVAVFVDGGMVKIIDPLPEQATSFELGSTGLGLRIGGWRGFDLGLDWAYALVNEGDVEAGDDRTHFGFSYSF